MKKIIIFGSAISVKVMYLSDEHPKERERRVVAIAMCDKDFCIC